MCYPCTHCNKCGRMPGPGLCGRCGYENDPHVRVCEACGMEFPAPPGMVAGTDGSSTQDDDA